MGKIIDFTKYTDDKEAFDKKFEEAIKKYETSDDWLTNEFLDLYYYMKRVEYELIIYQEEELEWKNNWGMGFWFVLIEYENNQLIKDYMAKKMLEEIYKDTEEFNLEEYMHIRFKSLDELKKIGIKNYILNSVYGYDECLNGYLSVHRELLSDIEKRINCIIQNWYNYEKNHNEKTVDFDELLKLTDVFVSHTDNCQYSTVELAYFLKFNMGIEWSENFKNLMDDFIDYSELEILDDIDKEYYDFLFNNTSSENQKILEEYKNYINKHIKNKNDIISYNSHKASRRKKLKLKNNKNN